MTANQPNEMSTDQDKDPLKQRLSELRAAYTTEGGMRHQPTHSLIDAVEKLAKIVTDWNHVYVETDCEYDDVHPVYLAGEQALASIAETLKGLPTK